MNSTFGNRLRRCGYRAVYLSIPSRRRGIVNGDAVRVFNDRGACLLIAKVNGDVSRGVVAAPSVRQIKRAAGGRNVNALVSERLTDMGGGPTFYSCLVQVERCGD